jgi:AcrR family transcriptional regulator
MTTAVKRPSGRDEVVEALLDAADRLFATSGPADVSLRAIAREAGVNHGMVYRHFGTRDDLVDRLLERIAARWTAETVATGDFTSALDSILARPDDAQASAGSWIRLLAWSLLIEAPGYSAAAQRRYATLDVLPGMLDDRSPHEAAVATATALALVFGWRFFHPYIRAALHLYDDPFAELHRAMGDAVQTLART